METKKSEQVIYLKDLLFAPLYRWRFVLIITVIAALLLGGLAVYTETRDDTAEELAYKKAVEEYQLNMDVLTAKKDMLERTLLAQQEYLNDSVYMNLNPYAFYTASLNLYVDTGYQVMPDHVYQDPDKTASVLAAYETGFCNKETIQQIAAIFETKPQYASELISCAYSSASGSFSVSIRCTTAEQAEAALQVLLSRLDAIALSVSETVTAHNYTLLNQAVTCKSDNAIAVRRSELSDNLTLMQKSLSENDLLIASMVAPNYCENTKASIIKQAVIFTVIGGVVGLFLGACITWVLHIISGKVYSAQTLRDRTGLKVIGCVQNTAPSCKFNRWLQSKEGRCTKTADEQAAFLATAVTSRYPDAKKILISGSVAKDAQAALTKALQAAAPEKQFICASDLLTSVEAQTVLCECDTVILVAQCGTSCYSTILAEAESVTEQDKTLAGCIVLGG